MDIITSTILSQNITLVYDSLNLQIIDTSELKGLVDTKTVVMDTPEMIVALYPPIQLVIQMGDRHIRITLQQETEEIGGFPLWDIASKCHQLISGSQLIAYGFNYDVGVVIANKDPQKIIRDLFVPDPQMIERSLEAKLTVFIPRLKFERDETEYDLILDTLDKQRIKAHLNAHFEQKTLPSQDKLQASFRQEFEYLMSLLSRLFKRGDE